MAHQRLGGIRHNSARQTFKDSRQLRFFFLVGPLPLQRRRPLPIPRLSSPPAAKDRALLASLSIPFLRTRTEPMPKGPLARQVVERLPTTMTLKGEVEVEVMVPAMAAMILPRRAMEREKSPLTLRTGLFTRVSISRSAREWTTCGVWANALQAHPSYCKYWCLQTRKLVANWFSKHLAKEQHDYKSEPLYLLEPEGRDLKHPTKRRGLCKVCYKPFDYFKRPEEYLEDEKPKVRVEDKYLLDHVEEHKKIAEANGKKAIADNQQFAPLKFFVMVALFVVRMSLNEIHAELSVPFTKLAKAVTVKLEAQTPSEPAGTDDLVSSAGYGPAVYTPHGSISGSSLKRSFSPPDGAQAPVRPQKQHRGVLEASRTIAVPASLESSPQAPSLDASNGLSLSDSSLSTFIDPNLEPALLSAQKSPTPSPRVLHADKLNAVTSSVPAIQAPPNSVHAIQDSQTSSSEDSPRTLPLADRPFAWHQDGLFWEPLVGGKTFRIENPLLMPNKATLLTDGAIVSWTGEKMMLASDGSFVRSYDPMYDVRQPREQND
jgi:hypothetical protein